MPVLVNWCAEKKGQQDPFFPEGSIVWGNVFGNGRFIDGQHIHTSRIEAINKEGNVLSIRTRDTVYECNLAMHILNKDQQLSTREVLMEYGFTKEEVNEMMKKMWDAFFPLDQKKKKLLTRLIPQKAAPYNLLEFSSEEEYYFRFFARKDQEGLRFWNEESLSVTIGQEQDIAEIRPKGLETTAEGQIVFRFSPCGEKRLRLWEGYEKYGGLSVRNGGLNLLTIEAGDGSYEVKPGECIVLCGCGEK